MTPSDYWEEAVSQSFDDFGIVATKEQIAGIAQDMEASHNGYDIAFGYEVASANLAEDKDSEIARLKANLAVERDKIVCPECSGRGSTGRSGARCLRCHGEGKI